MTETTNPDELVALTADIVSAYVSNNTVVNSELPTIINSVCEALAIASAKSEQPLKAELMPAVPIKKSVTPDASNSIDQDFDSTCSWSRSPIGNSMTLSFLLVSQPTAVCATSPPSPSFSRMKFMGSTQSEQRSACSI